jgi:hypothetical protein
MTTTLTTNGRTNGRATTRITEPRTAPADPPRVYSYARFSSTKQAKGNSEDRQGDDAQRWARRKGYPLADEYRLLDDGHSAYDGTHRIKGALGQFLADVKAKRVPKGSILFVSKASRLSREGVLTALKTTVFELIENGITLQLGEPELAFDQAAIEGPLFGVLTALLQAAHQESKDKQDYANDNWQRRRDAARDGKARLTKRCPAWLKPTDDATGWDVIPEAAEAIKLLFKLKAQGWGMPRLEKYMTANAAWAPPARKGPRPGGKGWQSKYMRRVLRWRAVLGEYQPCKAGRPDGDPIERYFPAIIDADLFHAVQRQMDENAGGGRTAGGAGGRGNGGGAWAFKAKNLLAGLAKCPYCGGAMHYIDRGSPDDPSPRYLACDAGRRGLKGADGKPRCKFHTMRYPEAEVLLLENLPALHPEDVLPTADEQAERCAALRMRIAAAAHKLTDTEDRIGKLTERLETTADMAIGDRIVTRMQELEASKDDLNKAKAADEQALKDAERARTTFDAWQRDLATLKAALATGALDVRLRLRARLREMLDRVEIYSDGHRKLHDRDEAQRALAKAPPFARGGMMRGADPALDDALDGERFAEDAWDIVQEHFPEKLSTAAARAEFNDFCQWVTARRLTKEGRFIRVWFRGGARIDLVPPGSLADGKRYDRQDERPGWESHGADLDALWTEWKGRTKDADGKADGDGRTKGNCPAA